METMNFWMEEPFNFIGQRLQYGKQAYCKRQYP